MGADADSGDGQSCFNGTRTAQAARLLTWINGTVLPAAGDPDVLLLGDFNSYAKEDPVTTLEAGGYTDLATSLFGSSVVLVPLRRPAGPPRLRLRQRQSAAQVTGVGDWHINADEVPLFDYNDEILDSPGEATSRRSPTARPSCRRASSSSPERRTAPPTTIR